MISTSNTNTVVTNTTINTTDIKLIKDLPLSRPYQESTPFNERYFEYQTIRCKYPDFVPIAFENYMHSPKNKLANEMLNFRFYVAKEMKLEAVKLFAKSLISTLDDNPNKLDLLKLFVHDTYVQDCNISVNDVYKAFKEKDGWLYIKFILEP